MRVGGGQPNLNSLPLRIANVGGIKKVSSSFKIVLNDLPSTCNAPFLMNALHYVRFCESSEDSFDNASGVALPGTCE